MYAINSIYTFFAVYFSINLSAICASVAISIDFRAIII